MKVINKMMAIILLSGTGIGSVQAQDTTPQTWTLRQCIDYVIEHNIDIRQTANEAEQNKIGVNTAKWARLPNLNGGISQGGAGDVQLLRKIIHIVILTVPVRE